MVQWYDYLTGGETTSVDPNKTVVPGKPTADNPTGRTIPIDKIVVDSADSGVQKLADQLGIKLSDQTKDYLYNAFFNNWLSEQAYNREMAASSTQYQRTVKDLQAAGLNPFLALQSLGGSSVSSSSGSVSGGSMTQRDTTKMSNKTDRQNAIARILAIIAAAAIYAMF